MGGNLPATTAHCPNTHKTVLMHFGEGNVPDIDKKSKFLTEDWVQSGNEFKRAGMLSAPDGSFFLDAQKLSCGDTQHYLVEFVSSDGEKKALERFKALCDNSIIISPDSKFILLSGMQYVDVKKWEICSLLGKPDDYGYYHILGWSKDANKILVREYSNWERPKSADEYIIEIDRK